MNDAGFCVVCPVVCVATDVAGQFSFVVVVALVNVVYKCFFVEFMQLVVKVFFSSRM